MQNLDDIQVIEKIDQARMHRVLKAFPGHCRQAYQLGKNFSLARNLRDVKNIVFSAMGGSAIGAEIASYYLRDEMKIPLNVNRDYSLPGFVDRESLVILISYSGNTEETLSAYKQAQKNKARVIVITSGGELAELAKRQGYPCLTIPAGFPPRAALAFLSLPVLAIFSQMRLIEDKQRQIDEIYQFLENSEIDSLGIDVKTQSNPAKKLAQRFFGNFCVVYGASEQLGGVVTRWRGQFAENSKTLCSSHLFPEMNHNEIVGWQHPEGLLKRFVAAILRDRQEHPQVQKRIEISKEILGKAGVQVEEVWSQGESLLARMFSLIYIGDFVSYYLAILNQEDPTPVKRIDYLKRRLKES